MSGDGVADVERWFLGRGPPHFVDGYSASRDVLTRTLPLLSLILLVELVGALNFEWASWINAMVAVGSFAALLTGVPRTRFVTAHELAVLLLVPAASPLVAGG